MKKDTGFLNKVKYLVFTPGHDRQKALDVYVKKFGKEPENITEDHNYLWLGPIEEMENGKE